VRTQTTTVTLRHGTTRGPLALKRCPKYLRFTIRGSDWSTLDALDQLDDEPLSGETLIAAFKTGEDNVHLDGTRNGRRCGWWERTAGYETIVEQPPQDVMRDRERWRAWCMEQAVAGGITKEQTG
jgi:hypothetical protein